MKKVFNRASLEADDMKNSLKQGFRSLNVEEIKTSLKELNKQITDAKAKDIARIQAMRQHQKKLSAKVNSILSTLKDNRDAATKRFRSIKSALVSNNVASEARSTRINKNLALAQKRTSDLTNAVHESHAATVAKVNELLTLANGLKTQLVDAEARAKSRINKTNAAATKNRAQMHSLVTEDAAAAAKVSESNGKIAAKVQSLAKAVKTLKERNKASAKIMQARMAEVSRQLRDIATDLRTTVKTQNSIQRNIGDVQLRVNEGMFFI